MNKPIQQHFVPDVYLNRFSNEEGKLYVFDIEKQQLRPSKSENEAKKRHIYTIEVNGEKDYKIEDFFNRIESNYSNHIQMIEQGKFKELSDDDLTEIVWFISFLYARNMSKTDRFTEVSNDLMDFVGQSILASESAQSDVNSPIEIKPNSSYVQKMSMQMLIKSAEVMFKMLSNEGRWLFCIAQSGSEFITTDDPMGNMVVVPLSNKVLFMRVTEEVEDISNELRVLPMAPSMVADINKQIAATAKRYMYATNVGLLEKIWQHKPQQ